MATATPKYGVKSVKLTLSPEEADILAAVLANTRIANSERGDIDILDPLLEAGADPDSWERDYSEKPKQYAHFRKYYG